MQIGDRVRRHKDYLDIRIGTIIDIHHKSNTTQINVQWKNRTSWHHKSSLAIAEKMPLATIVKNHEPDICICNQALPHSSIGIIENGEERYKLCALFSRDRKNMTHGFQELVIDRSQLIDLHNSIKNLLQSD